MNLSQKNKVLSDVKINLEDFMYNTFIDLPQTLGVNINEIHDDILSTLLTELAKNHSKYIIEEEDYE